MRPITLKVPDNQYSQFALEVIGRISDRFVSRLPDIEQFTNTGFGFENWLIAEAFASCRINETWYTEQNPKYHLEGVKDTNEAGDLKVYQSKEAIETGPGVFFEFALGRDYDAQPDRAKLSEKIINDVNKLKRLAEWTDSYLILLVIEVAKTDNADEPDWHSNLKKIDGVQSFFIEPLTFRFPHQGLMRLYYFAVKPNPQK